MWQSYQTIIQFPKLETANIFVSLLAQMHKKQKVISGSNNTFEKNIFCKEKNHFRIYKDIIKIRHLFMLD